MPQNEIIISVHGGAVRDVFCTRPKADVFIVDWDTSDCRPNDPGVVQLVTSRSKRLAKVIAFPATDACTLAGGLIERAIEAAIEQGALPEGVS